jgi:DNA-binding protein H-NS
MEQLHKLAEVIGEVIEQKKDEEVQRQEEEAEKARKLAEIREQINEAGLSLDDLVTEQPKRKRGRPPKNANANKG